MSSKRFKFCASCFNYINSCDCLGNLSDHAHLTDFEVPGKQEEDDDHNDDKGDVWYFRAQIGISLNEFGTLGVGAALRIPSMWTKVPPENPELYLSIPVERMDNFNPVNIAPPLRPVQMFTPQAPWEIEFFTVDSYNKQTKDDAQIAQELKDCLKKAAKKKAGKRIRVAICFASAGIKKGQQFFNPDAEALYDAVDDFLPENIEGYYGLIPYVSYVAPDRLVESLEQAIIPSWGHLWIEQHLIDGNDPVQDSSFDNLLINNVDGVDSFWTDNTQGGGDFNYQDYYGDITDPNTQARMLTMPHVPPPVPPVGPPRCTPWAIENGFCEDQKPPPYDNPPITTKPKPPTSPPIPPPPPVTMQPPAEPPEWPDDPTEELFNAPWAIAQLPIWESQFAPINTPFDYRNYPHFSWGSPVQGLVPDGTPYIAGLQLNVSDVNQPQTIPMELRFNWYYMGEGNLKDYTFRFDVKQNDTFGSVPDHTWTCIDYPLIAPKRKVGREYSVEFMVPRVAAREADNLLSYVRFQILILPPGSVKQKFTCTPYNAWAPSIKPVAIYFAAGLSPVGLFQGSQQDPNDTPDREDVNPIYTILGPNNTPTIRSLDNPWQWSFGDYGIVSPLPLFPTFLLGNGEMHIAPYPVSGSDKEWVVKMVNTGDGGLTPVTVPEYKDYLSRLAFGSKRQSLGSYFGYIAYNRI